jgi:hypothetical protein
VTDSYEVSDRVYEAYDHGGPHSAALLAACRLAVAEELTNLLDTFPSKTSWRDGVVIRTLQRRLQKLDVGSEWDLDPHEFTCDDGSGECTYTELNGVRCNTRRDQHARLEPGDDR